MENSSERKCILLHEKDNTVTALAALSKDQEITIDGDVSHGAIIVKQDISYAHKFARVLIAEGSDVIKYGEVIGIATTAIQPGEHVHVHNVESKRAGGSSS